mmetsp:Transcript_14759/g.12580  ORF Transcript_14759/g.12580 Transcript_14759/m.12580 type:complete len:466 (-) Transcript_14759:81-1478(-)
MSKLLIASALLLALAFAAGPDQWKDRTIYQLLTDRFARTDNSSTPCNDLSNYCGGTFQGIINNLDYITGMGFDAIWISPVVDNVDGGYHGYWARNWYEINSNFGSADDLKNLAQACHDKGVWLMIDVVGNHVGPVNMDYSSIVPFNQDSNYHSYCQIQNWNDQHEVEFCRLANLPDLAQEDQNTRHLLLEWVGDLVSNYSADGLRVDTVPEVPPDFWTEWTQDAGVYTVGEVFNGDMNYVASYQGPLDGLLNYPFFYAIRSVFQQGQSMNNLQNYFQAASSTYKDQSLMGNFVDNHDNARFLHDNGDHIALKSALGLSLSAVGIPIVYYGDEQAYGGGNDPNNREPLWTNMDTSSEIYQFIKTINAFRKESQFMTQSQTQRYSDDSFYAFTRGNYFFAFTNTQNTEQRTITYHPYSDGTTICNIFYPTQDCITVQNGQFQVSLDNGEVKMYSPKSSEIDIDEFEF